MHSKVLWGLLALSPALLSVARHEVETSSDRVEVTRGAALAAASRAA